MEESGLDQAHHNSMRLPYGLPTRKTWRLPKPSELTSRGLTTNVGEGHKSAARAEADLGPSLEVDLGPDLEAGLGPVLGAE